MNTPLKHLSKTFITAIAIFFAGMPLGSAQTTCTAQSKGAGNLFGGNVISFQLEDDTGVVFAYSGFTNNSSSVLINPSEVFDIIGGEYLTLTLTGSSDSTNAKWWTRCGIWFDANRDGNFGEDECIADPQNGPFKRLVKDTAITWIVRLPSVPVGGKALIRIRGCNNSFAMTAADACGNLNAYGNQHDFEVNAYYGINAIKGYSMPSIEVFPNPASGFLKFSGLNQGKIEILELSGKIIDSWNVLSGSDGLTYDVSTLTTGCYLARIQTPEGTVSKKFLVE